jgi:hypothetical protein
MFYLNQIWTFNFMSSNLNSNFGMLNSHVGLILWLTFRNNQVEKDDMIVIIINIIINE